MEKKKNYDDISLESFAATLIFLLISIEVRCSSALFILCAETHLMSGYERWIMIHSYLLHL